MRHSATRSLLERDDVIIVASVSCIYGIGSVETYTAMTFAIDRRRAASTSASCSPISSRCNTSATTWTSRRGTFRVRGDTIELFPAHLEDRAWRIALFGDEVEVDHRVRSADRPEGRPSSKSVKVYANSHYVTPRPTLAQAIKGIKEELKLRLDELTSAGRLLEAQRLEQRTPLRPRDDRGDRLLRRHRELFALSHRPQAGRAAADAVRIPARQRAGLRRREPRHHPADRRHVSRRLPPQGDARRIRLPPAVLHGQPAAALRGMGRDAAADRCTSRRRPGRGRWSAPAASSPSRSSARPA